MPPPDFLKPALEGSLVDAGVDVGIPFDGSAPDIGPFEYTGSLFSDGFEGRNTSAWTATVVARSAE